MQFGGPDDGAEIDELINFTFAGLNRRVGRAGFSPGQRVFGRQIRLPSSSLEDDFIDPHTKSARRQSRDAVERDNADGSCPRVRRRRLSPNDVTAAHPRRRKPQPVLVAGDPVFVPQTEGWSPRMVWTWRMRVE